jgi:hypothetical protein
VLRVHADHTLARGNALGRHKLLGGGAAAPPGRVFGAPSAREPEPCVAELIRSAYSAEEQAPDADLGKSMREGGRAAATQVEQPDGGGGGNDAHGGLLASQERRPTAAAGEASCRRSEARQLLAPPRSAELGVGHAELLAPRPRGEMAGLVAAAGLALGEEDFEAAFGAAADAEAGGGSDSHGGGKRCSLAGFMDARQQLLRRAAGM